MIKNTIILSRKTVCTCSAYPYPHAVGGGKCKQSLSARPDFVPPKRGLASKLCNFIDALELEVENDESVDLIANLIKTFKQELYGSLD